MNQARVPYSLWQLTRYMLGLGTWGFGGPVALIGHMNRDLVERRQWISEADYREGLALSQLMPGPLAAQLAIYLGYVHYGIAGATVAGVAFVVPSFLMVVGFGAAYVAYGGLQWMQAVFYGVGAAVIGIIAVSAYKLTTKSIGSDKLLWAIYLIAAGATIVTESESAWLFLAAGVLVWLAKAPPESLFRGGGPAMAALSAQLPNAAGPATVVDWPLLLQLGIFFAEAGAFVFGSGLAIVPFLGVTATAIGTISGAVVVLGKRSVTDFATVAILAVTLLLIWKVKKLPEPGAVILAALAGLIVYPMVKG